MCAFTKANYKLHDLVGPILEPNWSASSKSNFRWAEDFNFVLFKDALPCNFKVMARYSLLPTGKPRNSKEVLLKYTKAILLFEKNSMPAYPKLVYRTAFPCKRSDLCSQVLTFVRNPDHKGMSCIGRKHSSKSLATSK